MTLLDLLAWIVDQQVYRVGFVGDRHLAAFAALLGARPSGPSPARGLLWPQRPIAAERALAAGTPVTCATEPGPPVRARDRRSTSRRRDSPSWSSAVRRRPGGRPPRGRRTRALDLVASGTSRRPDDAASCASTGHSSRCHRHRCRSASSSSRRPATTRPGVHPGVRSASSTAAATSRGLRPSVVDRRHARPWRARVPWSCEVPTERRHASPVDPSELRLVLDADAVPLERRIPGSRSTCSPSSSRRRRWPPLDTPGTGLPDQAVPFDSTDLVDVDALEIRVGDEAWEPRPTLRERRTRRPRATSADRSELVFGNGVNGRVPPPDAAIQHWTGHPDARRPRPGPGGTRVERPRARTPSGIGVRHQRRPDRAAARARTDLAGLLAAARRTATEPQGPADRRGARDRGATAAGVRRGPRRGARRVPPGRARPTHRRHSDARRHPAPAAPDPASAPRPA